MVLLYYLIYYWRPWFDWYFQRMTPNYWNNNYSMYFFTIFKHWGINVKLHLLHIFGIVDWNLKDFKCICILYFIMPLMDFSIEIRFTCTKSLFNVIKINIKPMLWYCKLTLELEFIIVFVFIFFSDLRILSPKHYHLWIKPC